VLFGGFVKTKIRNEMTEEVSFFDSLSSKQHPMLETGLRISSS
jgi:hypothetical protein